MMTFKSALAPLFAISAVATPASRLDITNLGVSTFFLRTADGFVAFVVDENRDQRDVNGDGDFNDWLHVYDAVTKNLIAVGQSSSDFDIHHGRQFDIQNGRLIFEAHEAARDLNGDGDQHDVVLHAFDLRTGTLTHIGVDATNHIALNGDVLAVSVVEARQGRDLNGDGDLDDDVMHVYDLASRLLTNTGAQGGGPIGPNGIRITPQLVAFGAREFGHGDLNGDNDTNDRVLHVFDTATGAVTNLALAVRGFEAEGHRVEFTVYELDQGHRDLNGDGDFEDIVLHVYDGASGGIVTTTLSSTGIYAFDHGSILVKASEEHADLNGDGDTGDRVLHLVDAATAATLNLGVATDAFHAQSDFPRLAFTVDERQQGGRDLNGDGDALDTVLHVFNIATGVMRNVGLSASEFDLTLSGSRVLFRVHESSQGGADLNGNGHLQDYIPHIFDTATGSIINLGFAGGLEGVDGARAIYSVSEPSNGNRDLNGDGDAADAVLWLYDASTGATTNTGLAIGGGSPKFADGWVALPVPEFPADLNGDGDPFDFPVHVLPFAATLQERAERVFLELNDLIDLRVLNRGLGNALTSKIEHAVKEIQRGKTRTARQLLGAFRAHVHSLTNERKLSPEQARELLEAADGLVSAVDAAGVVSPRQRWPPPKRRVDREVDRLLRRPAAH